jgi:hypothetical protein
VLGNKPGVIAKAMCRERHWVSKRITWLENILEPYLSVE